MRKTDRQRNTFQYDNFDIAVEPDIESVSGLSFLIKDNSIPGNSYFAFAYFDELEKFIKAGCSWEAYIGSN